MKYKRILLKVSGEVLGGKEKFGLDYEYLTNLSKKIKEITDMGIQLGITIGGGNFWRGRNTLNLERNTRDNIGLIATIMNGLALEDIFTKNGIKTFLYSSIAITGICEETSLKEVNQKLDAGYVVIFAGGVGEPFFTTDTGATLRALQIGSEALFLGKAVDGIYTCDPKKDANATKYSEITYQEVLSKNLNALDIAAISLAKDNNLPIVVFGISDLDNILKAINGEKIGTIIK